MFSLIYVVKIEKKGYRALYVKAAEQFVSRGLQRCYLPSS